MPDDSVVDEIVLYMMEVLSDELEGLELQEMKLTVMLLIASLCTHLKRLERKDDE